MDTRPESSAVYRNNQDDDNAGHKISESSNSGPSKNKDMHQDLHIEETSLFSPFWYIYMYILNGMSRVLLVREVPLGLPNVLHCNCSI